MAYFYKVLFRKKLVNGLFSTQHNAPCVNIMANGIETMTQNISIIRRIYKL